MSAVELSKHKTYSEVFDACFNRYERKIGETHRSEASERRATFPKRNMIKDFGSLGERV